MRQEARCRSKEAQSIASSELEDEVDASIKKTAAECKRWNTAVAGRSLDPLLSSTRYQHAC